MASNSNTSSNVGSNRKLIKVHCVGIEPILFNAIPEGLLVNLAKGISTPKQKGADVDLQQIAANKVYIDDDGTPCIPRLNLFACLKYAGKFVKIGKKNITTADTTQLPSILTVRTSLARLNAGTPGTKTEWVMDLKAGRHRTGATKVMVALVRPRFDKWGFLTEVICGGDDGTIKTVKELFVNAGDKAGLGDYRPSSGGYFGRFVVNGWKVEDYVEEKQAVEMVEL